MVDDALVCLKSRCLGKTMSGDKLIRIFPFVYIQALREEQHPKDTEKEKIERNISVKYFHIHHVTWLDLCTIKNIEKRLNNRNMTKILNYNGKKLLFQFAQAVRSNKEFFSLVQLTQREVLWTQLDLPE